MGKSFIRLWAALIAVVIPCIPVSGGTNVCRTARALATAAFDAQDEDATFDIVATCTSREFDMLFFEDESGAMFASRDDGPALPPSIRPGLRLRIVGRLVRVKGRLLACYTRVTAVGYGAAAPATPVSGPDFVSGQYDFKPVSIVGRIDDIVPDEIDPDYQFLSILCDGRRILTPLPSGKTGLAIGALVSANGICMPGPLISRRFIGRILRREGKDQITVLEPPTESPFDAPPLTDFYALQPEEIFHLSRRKAVGQVVALWNGTKALVVTPSGQRIKTTFQESRLPRIGETVEVAGLPETDLFDINLSKAAWRRAEKEEVEGEGEQSINRLIEYSNNRMNEPSTSNSNSFSDMPTNDVSVGAIVRNVNGNTIFNPDLDGKCIRLSGTVRQLPSSLGLDSRLYLDCDSRLVPIDLTAAPQAIDGIHVESRIEATGICLLETEAWQPNLAFPRITGFTVAIRRTEDIRLLAPPSFWTARKLFVVIAVLGVVLVLFLVWNRTLQTLATRRSHQLFRERVAHYDAALRVDERTKLAVELHDSLAQSLTGAFMELETAESLGTGASAEMLRHLGIAAATVKSCHGELRNCLWDLRNLSLDEPNLDAAIRKTLSPHTRGLDVAVRFNVLRKRLTDNTTHAILRIVRELVLNAMRHGRATKIQVAGCIDGERLLFSVRDNGCGFDPDACPGIAQGHFGLEGIRERAGLLAGDLKIESEIGKGTKATVSIVLPSVREKAKVKR